MDKIRSRDSFILIFIFAASALVYEMVLASTLVFLFGDSIFYFSLTIAFFILFMGLGSSVSTWLSARPMPALFTAELVTSLVGGLSSLLVLWVAAETKDGFVTWIVSLLLTFLIGFAAGVEIPLLYKLTQKDSFSKFGTFLMYDYLGALCGAVLFSIVLLPRLDLIGSAVLVGAVNIFVLLVFVFRYRELFSKSIIWLGSVILSLALNVVIFSQHNQLQAKIDDKIFQLSPRTQTLYSFRTSYQKVMISLTPSEDIEQQHRQKVIAQSSVPPTTPWISVYLNNFTQSFAPLGADTDFYHHAFVHPAMVLADERKRVLVLGGGDGLPGKEIIKYPEVENIVTVDLDEQWVTFAKNNEDMRRHNFDSLGDPRVQLVINDAFQWVRMSKQIFDVIFVDFPEGVDFPLARSYSLQFLKDLKRIISDDGVISFQTDSFNNALYWSVVKTLQEAGFHIIPHRSLEFGHESYGFILASKKHKSLKDFDARVAQRSFINKKMLFSVFMMNEMRDERFVKNKTAGLMINTFFHPIFLYYYRTSQPWGIFIGNN
ncbi:MAG: hypothetical protein JNL11_01345 [Bdellovibrionaceae bacterium]|nr:hypothetical protein [Pseudobdellovibrionaceae bacterium]